MNKRNKEDELEFARESEADCTIMTGHGRHQRETITRAAIIYDDVIYSVPPPGRHHTVIQMMSAKGLPNEAMRLQNQGFVTSTGRFVDRYEGARIARAAGQIIREPTPPDMLTSEDVW
jgi:hypothetical protein